MQPFLIAIGEQVINLNSVTHMEVDGRGTVSFHFLGSSQVLSFTDPDAEAFRRFLEDSDHVVDLRVPKVRAGSSIGPTQKEPE